MDEKLRKEFFKTILRLKGLKSRFLAHTGISWEASMLLKKIAVDGNIHGICEMFSITKPAVTYMLNSLEKDGYIIRGIDASDRRRIDIKLTRKGRKIVETLINSYELFFNELLARFGDRNARDFIRLFNRFMDLTDEIKEKWENE